MWGKPFPYSWGSEKSKKVEERILRLWLTKLGPRFFLSGIYSSSTLDSQAFGLGLELHVLFAHSSVGGNVDCSAFCLLWIMLLWTSVHKTLCGCVFSLLMVLRSRVELLGQMAALCLTFWGTARLFSQVIAQFCILTRKVLGFQFCHIHVDTCHCLCFPF